MENLLDLLKDAQYAAAKGKWVEMDIDRRINTAVSEATQHGVQADLATGFRTAIIPCPHCGVNVTIDSDMLPSR